MKTPLFVFGVLVSLSGSAMAQYGNYYGGAAPYGGAPVQNYAPGYVPNQYAQPRNYNAPPQGYNPTPNYGYNPGYVPPSYGNYGYQTPPPPQPQAPVGAQDLLQEGIYKLINYIQQARAQGIQIRPEMALEFLDQEITPYFDFAYMARWAGGRTYARLSAEGKAMLEAKIKRMFYTTLASRLMSYEDQQLRFSAPQRGRDSKELSLPVILEQPGGLNIKLNFRMYLSSEGWKVFDVVANGTSAALHYRSHIRNMVRRYGQDWLRS